MDTLTIADKPWAKSLRPYQLTGAQYLADHDRALLADEPGLGKSRVALSAADGEDILVVAPAAIRDAKVWQDEAVAIGYPGKIEVVSYHQISRKGFPEPTLGSTVIFDEAHRLKERKVSWHRWAELAAERCGRVWLLTGTPTPNNATELWGQLSLLLELPSYWKWIKDWFLMEPTPYSAYNTNGNLLGCGHPADMYTDCEHWQNFRAQHLDPVMIRRLRDEVLTDLPPLTGDTTPLWTPMTATQKKAYNQMRKDLMASLPEEGVTLEALTKSGQFQTLMRLSTGLASVDPDSDPSDQHSGKAAMLRELLEDRDRPTLVAVWYRDTATWVTRMAESLGLRVESLGGATPTAQRGQIVSRFQAGEIDVLVGSVGVISEGLTLTAADEMVALERSWVPSTNTQVLRRLHRIGQTRPVSVRQLVTPGTADQAQWESLARKQEHIDRVVTRRDLSDLV